MHVGLGGGVVLAMVMFVVTYASSPQVHVSSLHQSHVVRSYQERSLLITHHGAIVRVRPQGYVFFGTAIRLLDEMKRHLIVQSPPPSSVNLAGSGVYDLSKAYTESFPLNQAHAPSSSNGNHYHSILPSTHVTLPLRPIDPSPDTAAVVRKVEYVVIDFSQVIGVDATSARNCFLLLTKILHTAGVIVVYTEMSDAIEKLLVAHGVIATPSADDMGSSMDFANGKNEREQAAGRGLVIPSLDDALEWCEDSLLER